MFLFENKPPDGILVFIFQMVIANLLHTRRKEVVMISSEMEEKVSVTEEELDAGKEIEEPLIEKLVQVHAEMLN